MIGPRMTPMPHTAIALAWRSGGLIWNKTAWLSGTSAAPHTPCSRRKMTSSARLCAAPHKAEAIVKPATENRNTYLMPNRPASQPVSGVMIAAATM